MSNLDTLIEAIPFIGTLRTAVVPYALLNAAHILCLGLLIGSILPLDLGLAGVPGFGWAGGVLEPLRRLALGGFAGAAATGFLLFAVRPLDYLDNDAFLFKLAAIAIAGSNALAFAFVSCPRVRRLQALASIAIWLSVVAAGRWIAFS